MGVPALFRWLSAKYPQIVEKVIEDVSTDDGDSLVNLCGANPNGVEFDNLYLDMNGIIHPCCHPMDKPAPATEELMMLEIFKYLDRIFGMIRPRKLLFMAIDGVAPRAKMNQQRSRRFRAAKERREKAERMAQLKDEKLQAQGQGTSTNQTYESDDEEDEFDGGFDSNCITPGTKFMDLVAKSIKYYIVDRMGREPAWKNLKVIFSDASVPGEGEHKIMDYIRRQRLDPDYDANTKHVIYGLDADLIMLSMATHEPHFRVLREDVFWEEQQKFARCSFCHNKGHDTDHCPERAKLDPSLLKKVDFSQKPFIFLDVAVLREYLELELRPQFSIPFKWDLERAIDDWIFLCFFVGNDFLPHLPSLELREGAIDTLIDIHKRNLSRMGGFICRDGKVNLKRAQFIMEELGRVEEQIFRKRREGQERSDSYHRRRIMSEIEQEERVCDSAEDQDTAKAAIRSKRAKFESNQKAQEDAEAADEVKLWEPGQKQRYYTRKFHFDADSSRQDLQIRQVVKSYVEGLCWVMAYYYQGCPSWKWYYPYHFAPLASDLINVGEFDFHFELGQPFRPFDQLMGVFPSDSKELVPEPFRDLMIEPSSEIIDFYPTDFAIDLNGKRNAWQGVVLLPFIDEERLLTALNKVYPYLEPNDVFMNIKGDDRLFIHKNHSVIALLEEKLDDDIHSTPLDPNLTDGLAGSVRRDILYPNEVFPTPLSLVPEIRDHQCASFIYQVPYHERIQLRHRASLLPNAILPFRTLPIEEVELIRSGGASSRVKGRIRLDGSAAAAGRHSMHQEYAQTYQKCDSGEHSSSHNRATSQNDHSRSEPPSAPSFSSHQYATPSAHPPPPSASIQARPPPAYSPFGSSSVGNRQRYSQNRFDALDHNRNTRSDPQSASSGPHASEGTRISPKREYEGDNNDPWRYRPPTSGQSTAGSKSRVEDLYGRYPPPN